MIDKTTTEDRMGLTGRALLAVAGWAVVAVSPALSQEADDFKAWPGKKGPLKAGFDFVLKDYPSLTGWEVVSDEKDLVEDEGVSEHFSRRMVLGHLKGAKDLLVEIRVVLTSTDEAQKILFQTDLGQFGGASGVKRVKEVNIGDVAVMGPIPPKNPNKSGHIHFVRNNIVVRLTELPDGKAEVIDLARDIDHKIKSQEGFTRAQLATRLPVISTFAPRDSTVHPLSSTPLSLSATDPFSRPVEFRFRSSVGVIKADASATPPTATFYSHEKTGTSTLTAWCVNSALLFGKAQATVDIVK
jgi:hypothetical protein